MNDKCFWKTGAIENSFISCRGDLIFEPDYPYCPYCGKLIELAIPDINIKGDKNDN